MAKLKIIFATFLVFMASVTLAERIDEDFEDDTVDENAEDLSDPKLVRLRFIKCRPLSGSSSISCQNRKHLKICTTCRTKVSTCFFTLRKGDELAESDEKDDNEAMVEDPKPHHRCRRLFCKITFRRIRFRKNKKTVDTCRRCYEVCRKH